MTGYVVLRTAFADSGEGYTLEAEVPEARSAEHACRLVATAMPADDLDGGVTLIAVPARQWASGRHTLKAETQRRIRPA